MSEENIVKLERRTPESMATYILAHIAMMEGRIAELEKKVCELEKSKETQQQKELDCNDEALWSYWP